MLVYTSGNPYVRLFFALKLDGARPQTIRNENEVHAVLNGEITDQSIMESYKKTAQTAAIESDYAEKVLSNLLKKINDSCTYIAPLNEEFKDELVRSLRS